jgi:putative ABC transport system permease protein
MQLEIGPIFRALMRNKMGAILIALQIAVTMTIIANGFFIIQQRSALIERESGLDIDNSFHLNSVSYAPNIDYSVMVTDDLAAIKQVSGVLDAVQVNAIPLSGSGWSMSLKTVPDDTVEGVGTAIYMVDDSVMTTFDLELVAGRNFDPTEIRWRQEGTGDWSDTGIITAKLAKRLFPDDGYADIVGKTAYIGDNESVLIIGIIDQLQAPWSGWDNLDHVMLTPDRLAWRGSRYYIRAEEGMRDQAMRSVEEVLANRLEGRMIQSMRSMEETRERSYSNQSAMIKMLSTVMIILTIITSMGIVGLASFSVNRRKKQIGTRRALGANQSDIVRYFLLENAVITAIGVVIGAVLTISLNMVLVETFALDRLDWFYIPVGMISLLIVGQIAALGPAKKAAAIPPAIATRSA